MCFSYQSLATSVGFVTTVAEDAAFCCVVRGHVLQQLPSFSHCCSAGTSQRRPPFPSALQPCSPFFPLREDTTARRDTPFPHSAALHPPLRAPQNFGWQWLLWFKLSDCPEQVMLWWCALPLPSGVAAAFNGCQHGLRLPIAAVVSCFSPGAVYCPGDPQHVSPLTPCAQLACTLYFHRLTLSKANEAPNH